MAAAAADPVAAVRRFNRFYTRQIGVLDEGLLHSPFTLTEVRVMYEVRHRPGITATAVRETLALDAGYLSRILRGLRRQGLVSARAPESDRRRRALTLTERGRQTFEALEGRSSEEVRGMLARLSRTQRRELVRAMRGIEGLLADSPAPTPASSPVILRDPLPGEMGWVVKRHGELYAAEYGWSAEFEGLVAGIVGQFVAGFDPRLERAWIAELRGEPAGSIFLVKETPRLAKLRLLLVEPWARGHGVGSRLVEACLGFAREAGYRKVRLWTNAELHAARRIYERAGFRMVDEARGRRFGQDQTFQTWELNLT